MMKYYMQNSLILCNFIWFLYAQQDYDVHYYKTMLMQKINMYQTFPHYLTALALCVTCFNMKSFLTHHQECKSEFTCFTDILTNQAIDIDNCYGTPLILTTFKIALHHIIKSKAKNQHFSRTVLSTLIQEELNETDDDETEKHLHIMDHALIKIKNSDFRAARYLVEQLPSFYTL